MLKSPDDDLIYEVLSYLQNNGSAAGAGSVQLYLTGRGFSVSEATAGRILRKLETSGLVEKNRNKGRELSDEGLKRLRELDDIKWQYRWTEKFMDTIASLKKDKLIQLLEACRPVEIGIARLAAARATQKDIDKIAANVEQMEKCAKEGKFPAELDTEFHCLLAAASGNPVLMSVIVLLRKKQENALGIAAIRAKVGAASCEDHRKILGALKWHDPEIAALAMKTHLNNLVDSLSNAK